VKDVKMTHANTKDTKDIYNVCQKSQTQNLYATVENVKYIHQIIQRVRNPVFLLVTAVRHPTKQAIVGTKAHTRVNHRKMDVLKILDVVESLALRRWNVAVLMLVNVIVAIVAKIQVKEKVVPPKYYATEHQTHTTQVRVKRWKTGRMNVYVF